jgi:hypothetical protein
MVVMTAERGDGDYEEMRSLRLAIPLPKAAKPPEQGMGLDTRVGARGNKGRKNRGKSRTKNCYIRKGISVYFCA